VDRYVSKFSGQVMVPPARVSFGHTCLAWLGALLTIGTLGWLSSISHAPLMLASFGASCVLLFGYPDSHFSQPRNTIGGHLIAAAIGLSTTHAFGENWQSMALAVATAIALMKLTRTVHPPAGSTAIIAAHQHLVWAFLLAPVLVGAAALVLFAALYNNILEHRRYPLYWW
jgi:CBS-domain-containing membrane protein